VKEESLSVLGENKGVNFVESVTLFEVQKRDVKLCGDFFMTGIVMKLFNKVSILTVVILISLNDRHRGKCGQQWAMKMKVFVDEEETEVINMILCNFDINAF